MKSITAKHVTGVEPPAPTRAQLPVRTGFERPVYCDGWFPRQHNYHPLAPHRCDHMLDLPGHTG